MVNPEITNILHRHLQMGDNDHKVLTLASGQNVVLGAVLGIVTIGGELEIAQSAVVDGAELARYIAAEAVDATAGAKNITVVSSGLVDESLVVFDGSDTFDTVVTGQKDSYREMLRSYGIDAKAFPDHYIQDNQP